MSVTVARERAAPTATAQALARLHQAVIGEGFLTTLGSRFLTALYHALSRDPLVYLSVARDGDRVVGFACTSLDLGATYRRFLVRRGAKAALAAARHLSRPRNVRHALETLRASRVGSAGGDGSHDLPVLMNFCVDAAYQRAGLGRRMLAATARWLEAEGHDTFVAVTGEGQRSAVSFYERIGASDEGAIVVHNEAQSRKFRIDTRLLPSEATTEP